MGIGLAFAGTTEEGVEEDDERRTSAGRRRPARVAAATRRVEIMTFDHCPLREYGSWLRDGCARGRSRERGRTKKEITDYSGGVSRIRDDARMTRLYKMSRRPNGGDSTKLRWLSTWTSSQTRRKQLCKLPFSLRKTTPIHKVGYLLSLPH